MQGEPKSVQRSFRFSPHTVELLDQEAASSGMSRNALAEQLLSEALRVTHHPLIRFQQGAGRRRQPLVVGTRLYVHQVVATLRESNGDLAEAAAYLRLTPAQVRAARDYYADFRAEVDDDAATAAQFEQAERDRWERQQRALA